MNKEELFSSLRAQGFSGPILDAFTQVPRENFVLPAFKDLTYEDTALPLAAGATISQPSTIAFMLQLLDLRKGQKILEIGSGSGYVLALLEEIAHGKIYGLEISRELAEKSRELLKDKRNVHILHKNGMKGLLSHAPYDRILVSAAFKEVPYYLKRQLKRGGILVVPVNHSIIKLRKHIIGVEEIEYNGFSFVSLMNAPIEE
ncbi:protein-L-isoaspartate O-methyltransferase [Candidatus Pacearchaeota archaeon]|nr:protein-L-isoaspartate O-methyltransferase [Candidatus Pacearchaeota archaeon]